MPVARCSRLLRQFSSTSAFRVDSRFNLGGLKSSPGGSKSRPQKPRAPPKDWSALPTTRQPRAIPRDHPQQHQKRHPEANHRSPRPPRSPRPLASTSRGAPGVTGPRTVQEADEANSDIALSSRADESDDGIERPAAKRTTRKKSDDQSFSKAYWKNVAKEKAAADAARAKKVHGTNKQQLKRQPKRKQVAHSLEIPTLVTVSNFARLLNVKLGQWSQ